MGKHCRKCSTELIVGKNINQRKIDRYDYMCYQCNWSTYAKKSKAKRKAEGKDYYKGWDDGHYTVYLLPHSNYVGMTKCFKQRLRVHKCDKTADITDAQILHIVSTRNEARQLEDEYHDKGYIGKYGYKGVI